MGIQTIDFQGCRVHTIHTNRNLLDMRVFVTVVLLAVVALLAGDVSGGGVGSKCAGRRSAPCDSGLKCCGWWRWKRCRECCNDGDCGDGKFCANYPGISRTCKARGTKANMTPCRNGSQCASGNCCAANPRIPFLKVCKASC